MSYAHHRDFDQNTANTSVPGRVRTRTPRPIAQVRVRDICFWSSAILTGHLAISELSRFVRGSIDRWSLVVIGFKLGSHTGSQLVLLT